MSHTKFDDRGIPILNLEDKIKALRYCLSLDNPKEDAMGHLFDLINFIAPGYQFLHFKGIQEICDYYGLNPTPIVDDRR